MDTEALIPKEFSIVCSSCNCVQNGPCDSETLLTETNQACTERYILHLEQEKACLVWIFPWPVSGTQTIWTPKDAAKILSQHLAAKGRDAASFAYRMSSEKNNEALNCVIIPLPFASPYDVSLGLSHEETKSLSEAREFSRGDQMVGWRTESQCNGWVHRRLCTLMLMFCAIIIVGLPLMLFAGPRSWLQREEIYQRYDVSGSSGPRFQLQFSYSNVSEWASKHPHTDGQWFLRIDDQAMIPAELVDEEELRYQTWYQKRYPEMDQIRLSELYLDEEFLSDPKSILVPADETFHMSHCVLALRRYWQARETGRHVCPRDIDYKHVKHCLDALDEWAFPEGARGDVAATASDPADGNKNTLRLIWKTKVCFDE